MTGTADIITLFKAVLSATSSLGQAISSIRGKTDAETQKLTDVQSSVLDLQSRIIELQKTALTKQEELLTLKTDNSQLREQIRKYEMQSTERERYERRKIGDAWVMVPKGENEPMFCSTCFEKGTLNALQPMASAFEIMGSHWCPTCQLPLSLK